MGCDLGLRRARPEWQQLKNKGEIGLDPQCTNVSLIILAGSLASLSLSSRPALRSCLTIKTLAAMAIATGEDEVNTASNATRVGRNVFFCDALLPRWQRKKSPGEEPTGANPG
jgi:hypothetical protein